MIPETPAAVRKVLRARGLRPRKKRGQNFLADPNVRDAIVRDSTVRPGDVVLEVGPGLGVLTKGLLDTGARVVAGELDEGLADFLTEELGEREAFRLVRGDALDGGGLAPALADAVREERQAGGRFLLVANLPYGIATSLLAAVAGGEDPPERIVVMVQKEVADRMAGRPGTGEYGPLAVLLALRGRVTVLRELSGRVFWPRALVRSAVAELVRSPVDPAALAAGNRAARLAFRYRRKTLRKALAVSGIPPERTKRALAAAGVDPMSRPEVITPEQFVALGEVLFAGEDDPPV